MLFASFARCDKHKLRGKFLFFRSEFEALRKTERMKNPKLTDVAWLGPRDEMDRASHYFGRCSECNEIICVAKAVTDGPSTQRETSEMLHEAFRTHSKLRHSED